LEKREANKFVIGKQKAFLSNLENDLNYWSTIEKDILIHRISDLSRLVEDN
jgi:hypothetical protein